MSNGCRYSIIDYRAMMKRGGIMRLNINIICIVRIEKGKKKLSIAPPANKNL